MTTCDESTTNTLIIENEALRRGFTIIPNCVLSNPKLSFGARLTYTLLLSYAWQQGACFPGQDKLAAHLQTNPRSVRRYLTELKAQGLIKVKQRGLGKPNVYILTDFASSVEADRTQVSTQDRTALSALDRTPLSDEEDSGEEDSERQRLSTVNRLAVEEGSEGAATGFSRVDKLLKRRSVRKESRQLADKKLEVAPLVEEAARKLKAPGSLGMFYKVLLQLYPEHLYLFEEAVKEAAEEPEARVSRSALFAHIIRRLAREHSVRLSLGEQHTAGSGAALDAGNRSEYRKDSNKSTVRVQTGE